MIETKLFQTTRKQLQLKPKPVKIKHKTYRQLLGLDRPKKQIQIESDNDNDDFLEKLLKEQQKQKKKKTSLKKSHTSKNNKKNKKVVKQPNDSEQLKRQTIAPSKNLTSQGNHTKQKQLKTSKEKLSKIFDGNNTESSRRNKNNQTAKSMKQQTNSKIKQNVENSNIKIDQSDQVPYMITNNFPAILNSTKSFQGFKILQNSRKNSQQLFEIKPKLNPESHTIVHNIKKLPSYPQFKATVLSAEKLLAMSEIKVAAVRETRVFRRERLFKNQDEEDRFIKSLQTVKPKKYTMPSLL